MTILMISQLFHAILLFSLFGFTQPKVIIPQDSNITRATVYFKDGKYRCEVGFIDSDEGIAFGTYKDSFLSSGWDFLDISMTKKSGFTDQEKYYALGYLESCLTHTRISNHLVNMNSWMLKDYGGKIPKFMSDFYTTQEKFVLTMYEMHKTDKFWKTTGLLLFQLYGMIDRYNIDQKTNETYTGFQTMSFGDMFDLQRLGSKNGQDLGPKKSTKRRRTTHCTAAIKVMYDLSDIFVGHNTWFHYPVMTRIFKTYSFHDEYVDNTISMSSYPGTLSSQDDFVVTDHLYVMETSFEIYNTELFKKIVPQSVFTWQRSMVANILSTNGEEWVNLFSQHSSGTYNNCWMIIDLSKFVPYEHFQPGLFTVLEQLPGYIKSEDLSNLLALGYWPNYNSPFFQTTYDLSGYGSLKNTSDDINIWGSQVSVRAKMFRRDSGDWKSYEEFKKFMRYSEWKNDRLSMNDPGYTIAPRFDLRVEKKNGEREPGCWGNLDAKTTSIGRLLEGRRTVDVISGPPNNQVDAPIFDWANAKSCDGYTHQGMPEKWNFGWETVEIP